ncbi:uncharacterized protein si:ch211-199g17.9 isoform X2 [Osmerus eperlanus]
MKPPMIEGANGKPKVEQLMTKLRMLQQGNRVLEDELKEAQSTNDSLQLELDTVQTKAYQLEGIHKETDESCRVLQFQCEEIEQDTNRHLQLNRKSEGLVEQYRCQIQEAKLKCRKQRMRFENQLQQLIEQHKSLHSVFTTERLPTEIETVENTQSHLLTAEHLKLLQLRHLEEELEELTKQT